MKTPSKSQGRKKQAALEQDWVRDIREGNSRAFERLFRTYCGPLVNFARRFGLDLPVAENIVQDVFLSVWTRRTQLDPVAAIRAYLYTAVRNQALKQLRHEKVEQRSREAMSTSRLAEDTPEKNWSQQELAGEIRSAVDQLPQRCRTIFTMSRYDNLTYGEIAQILGISVKTVETQMGRALKSLRSSLSHILDSLS
ncbi:MAG: RNA polymerase sigma-70 factor [Fidelibacterota bacterium]|nr:MAG: RNA polymerase sigma-70 factor [Candidatus Neomarinimicrobiota bacterium]